MATTNPHRASDGRKGRKLALGIDLGSDVKQLRADYQLHQSRRGVRTGSISRISDVLRLFCEFMDPASPIEATPAQIDAWLDSRQLSARTRYSYVSHLHGFYEWAVIYEHADRDPTLRVIRPRFPNSIPRPIPDDELAHALRMAAPRERAVMALAAFHGLRAFEIARLQREDILDMNDPPVLIVAEGKGGHQRVLPLHPQAWGLIRAWAAGRRHGWLFVDERTGRNVEPWAVSHWVNALLHDMGSASTLHSLRHWYGTKVYGVSKDLRVTQALLGHSSPNTTVGYVAFSAVDARHAVEELSLPGV